MSLIVLAIRMKYCSSRTRTNLDFGPGPIYLNLDPSNLSLSTHLSAIEYRKPYIYMRRTRVLHTWPV